MAILKQGYCTQPNLKQNGLFQLEETYINHLVQLPDFSRADQNSKIVIKVTAQMSLQYLGHQLPLQETCSSIWPPSW